MTRRSLISVISLLALVLFPACGAFSSGMEMAKANNLVGEANAANMEAAKSIEESNKRFAQLFSSDVDLDDRKKFEPTAKDALDSLDKAHAKLLEGIQKLETASNLGVEDWYKTYLTTMAQSYRNTDQRASVLKDMARLYMDYSLDAQTLQTRYKELLEKDNKLEKDSADIDAKIKKIEADNKDRMKS
jgi:hypothetical protein